jgi:hypothetical protein
MIFVFARPCTNDPSKLSRAPKEGLQQQNRLRYVCVDMRPRITAGFRDGACAGPKR